MKLKSVYYIVKVSGRDVGLCALFIAMMLAACTPVEKPQVQALVYDGDGRAWVGTANGLYAQDDDSILKRFPLPSLTHHPYPSIYALAVDTMRQRIWVGAWNHLYCYDQHHHRFITTSDSTIYRTVALSIDSLGRVLARTERGLFRMTLADSLPEGSAEQVDNRYYAKPDITAINTGGLTFEDTSEGQGSWPWIVLAIITGVVIVSILFFIRNKKTTVRDSDKTIDPHPSEEVEGDDALPPRPAFLEQAAKVADAHLSDEDFSPEQFASEMAVSRAQLFRKLKAAGGQTVMEFINERRLARAATLLATTDRTILDVATACGFADVGNFRRQFAKRFGTTPSAYRQEHTDI